MNLEQKQVIKTALIEYVAKMGSQAKASNSLKNISTATLNHMINEKWELIKDEMWLNVSNQLKWQLSNWVTVQTKDFKVLTHILNDAKTHSMALGVIAPAGSGKSQTAKSFVEHNKNAFLLSCGEYWNRKHFLAQLLEKMGRDSGGFTVAMMMAEVVRVLKQTQNPLIILDEADKLTDQVLYFFITLYNELEDHCAIILMATNHLEKRIRKGFNNNKKGYNEIFSRIGRKFIQLDGVGSEDVMQVCKANGIESLADIKNIIKGSDLDLRRVKRMIHSTKLQNLNKA